MLTNLFGLFGVSKTARNEISLEIDLLAAMQAHAMWKIRLANLLKGSQDDSLDPEIVCRDDQCTLGRWIHGNGHTHFAHSELFHFLKHEHVLFHQCAAKVVEAYQAGNLATAANLLSNDFSEQSRKTMGYLSKLHKELEQVEVIS